MKLTEFRQTIFVTHEGYNKIELEFDEVIKGSKIEILETEKLVTDLKDYIMVPSVKYEITTLVLLKLPDGTTVTYTKRLLPPEKAIISFIPCAVSDDCKLNKVIDMTKSFQNYRYTVKNFFQFNEFQD